LRASPQGARTMAGVPMTRKRALLAFSAILIAFVALLAAGSPRADAAPIAARATTSDGGARAYWTRARMRSAEPVEAVHARHLQRSVSASRGGKPTYVPPSGAARLRSGTVSSGHGRILGTNRDEILDPAAPEFAAHGKVFFSIPRGTEAGDYVCSGTAVNSRNRSVVWTAGHCVYDFESPTPGGFSTNFIFVPGYSEDAAGTAVEPYGEWPAKKLATTTFWKTAGNIRYDLGAAVVRANATGGKLQDVAGATGIGFNQPREQSLQAFGYPAEQPPLEFTGGREFRCTGAPIGTDQPSGGAGPATTGIDCDMTPGSSGGGWIAGTTVPVLVSVTSYGYPTEVDHLYGPYMGDTAKVLYRGVRGGKKKKK
jgi:V8-like Glu-specific endopeptidase